MSKTAKGVIGVRVDQALIAELAEVQAMLSAKASGMDVNQSDAARAALIRGVKVLKEELSR